MRSRNIKPGFFKNEILGTQDPLLSLLYIGLWCLADKDGILEDRPLRIKAELFPYRENLDINGYLTVISRLGFIHRYTSDGSGYIMIPNFQKHQNPHHTEKVSDYPKPTESQTIKWKEDIKNNGGITVKQPLSNGELPVRLLLIPDSIKDSIKDSRLLIPQTPTEEKKSKKFIPPTIEEVKEYIAKNKYHVNAETFHKYFTEGDWIDSKGNKVKNWKLKIITWEGNNGQIGRSKQPPAGEEKKPSKYANLECETINTDDP